MILGFPNKYEWELTKFNLPSGELEYFFHCWTESEDHYLLEKDPQIMYNKVCKLVENLCQKDS